MLVHRRTEPLREVDVGPCEHLREVIVGPRGRISMARQGLGRIGGVDVL